MKKILYVFLIAVTACSCNLGDTKKESRPKSELALIREINIADSNYRAQINEITQNEAYEMSVKRISQFIVNDLKAKAENWEARVQEINLDDDVVIIELIIAKGLQFDEKVPQYEAIALRCQVTADERLKSLIRPLIKGEDVIVSGNFLTDKDAGDNITFNSYVGAGAKQILSNPVFDFSITDIKSK